MGEQQSKARAVLAKWGPYAVIVILLGLLVWSRIGRGVWPWSGSRKPANEVIVSVNGQPITQQQLLRALEQADQEDPRQREMEKLVAVRLVEEELTRRKVKMTQQDYLSLMGRADAYFNMVAGGPIPWQKALDQLIRQQLVRQEADKRGAKVSQAELQARLDLAKDGILASTGRAFPDWLAATGQTEQEFADQTSFEILLGKLVLPTENRQQFYEANKKQLAELPQNNESVIYRHIVVAKKEEAEAIRKELLAGGKTAGFAKLAEQRSLDASSRSRGGMMGWAVKGKTSPPDPELEKVLFSLKPGEVSQPLPVDASGVTPKAGEAPKFWRLVEVEKHIYPHEMTMEANAGTIEQFMQGDPQFQKALDDFYSNLLASAKITFVDPRYSELGKVYDRMRQRREEMSRLAPGRQAPGAAGVPSPEPQTPSPSPPPAGARPGAGGGQARQGR